jgi:putative xylitol transport system permease protein
LLSTLVVLCAVAGALSRSFLTVSNGTNVAQAIALTGIVSVGQTIVLIGGGIDLSVGAVAAVAGLVLVKTQALTMPVAVVVALAAATGVGLFHGVVIVKTGINSLVVTLATLTALRGGVYVVTDGFPVPLHSLGIQGVLWSNVGPVPVPFLFLAVLIVLGYVVLSWTRFGTALYATGGNPKAAHEAGIRVNRQRVIAFAVSGALAGLAGVLLAARFGAAAANAGQGWELVTIAAVVIGGTSLSGGRGDLLGTMIGVLLLGVISNAMDLIGINSFYEQVVQGLLILAAVGVSSMRQRRDSVAIGFGG